MNKHAHCPEKGIETATQKASLPAYISVPNIPCIWRIFSHYPFRLKLMRSFVILSEEIRKNPAKYQSITGPYLSMIAEYAGVNRRTSMINLGQLEEIGIVKHRYVPYEIRGRKQLVKYMSQV